MRNRHVTKQSSLKRNFMMNALSVTASIVFPLITFAYVSRVLTPAGRGKVTFAISIVSYFRLISQLGIPTYGIRICAQIRDDREKLSRTVQELFFINLLMTLVSYTLLFVLIRFVPRLQEASTLLLICSLEILLALFGVDWLFRALEEYTYLSIVSVAFRVIGLTLTFLLVHTESDYPVYAWITVITGYGFLLVNFLRTHRFITLRPLGNYNLRPHVRAILVFFAMSCAISIYTHLDTTMLGFMKTDADVGYYSVAVQIKVLLVTVVTSLGAVLLPRASWYIEQKRMEEFRALSMKALHFVVLMAGPLMVYFMLYAPEGIAFISGGAYTPSIVPMRVIMPTILLIGLTNILGIQMLVPLGREHIVLYSVLAGAVTDLVLNWFLIPPFASAGASAGTLVAEAVVLIVQAYALRDLFFKAMRQIPFTMLIPALVVSGFAAYPVKLLALRALPALACSAVVFFVSYVVILYFVREPLIREMVSIADDRVKALLRRS